MREIVEIEGAPPIHLVEVEIMKEVVQKGHQKNLKKREKLKREKLRILKREGEEVKTVKRVKMVTQERRIEVTKERGEKEIEISNDLERGNVIQEEEMGRKEQRERELSERESNASEETKIERREEKEKEENEREKGGETETENETEREKEKRKETEAIEMESQTKIEGGRRCQKRMKCVLMNLGDLFLSKETAHQVQ